MNRENENGKKEDLRIIKTRKLIRDSFQEMIAEMDYKDITIKELTGRARINRKTFYLHYPNLDALLEELQQEIIENYTKRDIHYTDIEKIKELIRIFFEHAETKPEVFEKILCSGSYQSIWEKINQGIMNFRQAENSGAFSDNPSVDSLVFSFFGHITTMLYRQWVADGKQLSVDEMIETSQNLICYGISSFMNH